MTTTFYQLPIGARFEFRGRRYEKLALSLARDEDRCGNVFQDQCQVIWHCQPGEQPGPPRKPEPHWTTYLDPAPSPVPPRRPPDFHPRIAAPSRPRVSTRVWETID
jgi:hypothetical protein